MIKKESKENLNLNNSTNITNLKSNDDTSLILNENKRDDNTNNTDNLSLLEKLMKNNNIKPKKNNEQRDMSNNEKNKTSDNISGKFLITNQSNDSSFIINNRCNDNSKDNNIENNQPINYRLKFGKTNNISFDKSKILAKKIKKDFIKKDKFDDIPLWKENDNNDLDFSINTVCNDKNDKKLNSMPNNFKANFYSISSMKTDNLQNIENSKIYDLDKPSNGNLCNYIDNQKFQHNFSYNMNGRPQSGIIFDNEENNKHLISNYDKFNNTFTNSNDSLISNYSKNSIEYLNDNLIIPTENEGFDSAEETVFIRREESVNKKNEKNEILIVINLIYR